MRVVARVAGVLWLLVALTMAAGLAAACGGNGAFPDPVPCPSPSPLPTSGRDAVNGPYRIALQQGTQQIERLTSDFRARWPKTRPSNSSGFRTEYAAYADKVVCLASDLRALPPPSEPFVEFDAAFDRVITDVIDATNDGRAAVKQRNVTDYRAWHTGIEGKLLAVDRTLTLLPR